MLPLLKLADRFAPAGMTDPLRVQRQRAAVVQSWIGVMFTALFGGLYFVMGSPWSGAAILLITAGLLVTPPALRRGYSRI
jgi:hypothetical protein